MWAGGWVEDAAESGEAEFGFAVSESVEDDGDAFIEVGMLV